MSKNWTKGPWVYSELRPYEDGLGYVRADGCDIIHAGVTNIAPEENRANGHLISASPELYDALENLLNGIRSNLVRVDAIADETWANGLRKADAALAKARGES